MKKLDCQFCGSEFNAERISAKYCCDSCKTRANTQRRQNELTQYLNEQQQELFEMEVQRQLKLDEKIAAEKVEQERQIAKQQKQKEVRERLLEKEKHEKESNKRKKEADENFKLKICGVLAILELGYQIYKN